MNRFVLGIDTSNYKTSVALVDSYGKVAFNRSEFLQVDKGERGLRQQTALFKHNQNLPEFIEDAFRAVDPSEIRAIAVSSAPRSTDGSYMPVFTAGTNTAKILAAALNIPVYECSHQEGHIAAILHGSTGYNAEALNDGEISIKYRDGRVKGKSCLMFHLSGGTTEVLRCRLVKSPEGIFHYETEIIGGTKDISIGQLFDRVGVRAGYNFPAGKYLDSYSMEHQWSDEDPLPSKIKLDDGYFNLSGIESEMMRAFGGDEESPELTAEGMKLVPGMFERITSLLFDTALYLTDKYELSDVFVAGGVAASEYIRMRLDEVRSTAVRKHRAGIISEDIPKLHFGEQLLSGDNAIGVAWLGNMSVKG